MPLKDDSKTSTRTIRENASIVGTLFDLFLLEDLFFSPRLDVFILCDLSLICFYQCSYFFLSIKVKK